MAPSGPTTCDGAASFYSTNQSIYSGFTGAAWSAGAASCAPTGDTKKPPPSRNTRCRPVNIRKNEIPRRGPEYPFPTCILLCFLILTTFTRLPPLPMPLTKIPYISLNSIVSLTLIIYRNVFLECIHTTSREYPFSPHYLRPQRTSDYPSIIVWILGMFVKKKICVTVGFIVWGIRGMAVLTGPSIWGTLTNQ